MKRFIILLLFMLLAAISVSALNLEECIKLAMSNNKDLLAAQEDKAMADELYYDVRGNLLPQISLQGGYQLKTTWLPNSAVPGKMDFMPALSSGASADDSTLAGILTGFANNMIPGSPQKEGSLAAQIQLNQILFSGGRLINGITAVARYRSIQLLQILLIKQELYKKTMDMFYQTILAKKVWEIQQEGLVTANRHLSRVQILNTEGQVSEFDLLRAQLEVVKLKPEVVSAKNNYELALAALKKHIGTTDEAFTADGDFILPAQSEYFDLAQPDSLMIDLHTAQANAATRRLELKLAAINSEIQGIRYRAEKGNYLPNVMLTADYSLFTAADEYAIEGDDFGSAFNVGIGFSIPLFTGFSNTAKRSYARHGWMQAQIKETDASEWINLEVKQTYQNLETALENYRVQLENIRLAERSLQLAQVRFENQVGIQLEVFDAQIMLSSVKLSYYNSIYEVISANHNLKKAMGFLF
jgi:outer membrane protein TolC